MSNYCYHCNRHTINKNRCTKCGMFPKAIHLKWGNHNCLVCNKCKDVARLTKLIQDVTCKDCLKSFEFQKIKQQVE